MSTVQMRSEIGKMLVVADDRMLSAIHSMLADYLKNDFSIVGFLADGTPITRAELLETVEKSRLDALAGKSKTVESMLEEVENW